MKARFAKRIGRTVILKESSCEHACDILGDLTWKEISFDQDYTCKKCGQRFRPDTGQSLYNTPSGDLEPGCLYWHFDTPENYYWDNHTGPHLCAVLPTGAHWVVDSRASNCDMKQDRTHRCWVRVGDPETGNVHVDKVGHTCHAGAGSIWAEKGCPREWHGFLHHGEFRKC